LILNGIKISDRTKEKILKVCRDLDYYPNIHAAIMISDSMTIQAGINVVPEIIQTAPEAIICGNDRLAIGAEIGLSRAGLNIPADIMLTGADNIELSEYCSVPLTTFDQMAKACAQESAIRLLDYLQHKKTLTSMKIKPEIYIRQSTRH